MSVNPNRKPHFSLMNTDLPFCFNVFDWCNIVTGDITFYSILNRPCIPPVIMVTLIDNLKLIT